MIFKQKPVFLKIFNTVIYMFPLKKERNYWQAAGTERWQSLYVYYFVLVSYSSFKIDIFTANRF